VTVELIVKLCETETEPGAGVADRGCVEDSERVRSSECASVGVPTGITVSLDVISCDGDNDGVGKDVFVGVVINVGEMDDVVDSSVLEEIDTD
jgi:hypothetical protein